MTKLARLEAAATVMLVRDGAAGIEVFMMGRRGDLEVAPRALVFPGGKVDEADASRGLAERCAGAAAWDDEERAFRVAAVRESFEECGLLLARRQGGEVLLGGDEAAALRRRRATRCEPGDARPAPGSQSVAAPCTASRSLAASRTGPTGSPSRR